MKPVAFAVLAFCLQLTAAQLCSSPVDKYICLPNGQIYDCATRYLEDQCLNGKVCIPGQASIQKACYAPVNTCTRAGSFALTDLNPCVDFYMCGATDAVPVYSRCSDGTFFNPAVQACDRGFVQGCTPTTTPQPTTTPSSTSCTQAQAGLKRAVPGKCVIYEQCSGSKWEAYSCLGYYFDYKANSCTGTSPSVCL